ncbi:MAG: phosphoribosylanthranilate isomerase [Gemmatimonadaceae bacterium]|nr:phosphoribosylanthranilate isomerase [Gemmatimonadaceae bacterium]
MTGIKFCGITRGSDARVAASLGAAYIGVIFAESKRRVKPDMAREITSGMENGPRIVGVFDDLPIAEMARIADEAALDVVQLHGRFRPQDVAMLRRGFAGEIWAVCGLDPTASTVPGEAVELADVADAIVLDARVGGVTGGTGRTLDWTGLAIAARSLSRATYIVLAGGLTPDNVGEAIAVIAPAVVDVSSGVESSPGIKDPGLMQAFAEAVRSASLE